MSDLIRRQDAIDALTEANLKSHMDSVEGGQENRSAIRIIMELPSAERKRGEWIAYNGDDSNWLRNDGSPVFMQCSECNTMVVNNFAFNWNYCPNCGAKMDEREE